MPPSLNISSKSLGKIPKTPAHLKNPLTFADGVAQLLLLLFFLVAISNRSLISDMENGNVERLERLEKLAEEAKAWLLVMHNEKVC